MNPKNHLRATVDSRVSKIIHLRDYPYIPLIVYCTYIGIYYAFLAYFFTTTDESS
jgi:hypothetical protein